MDYKHYKRIAVLFFGVSLAIGLGVIAEHYAKLPAKPEKQYVKFNYKKWQQDSVVTSKEFKVNNGWKAKLIK